MENTKNIIMNGDRAQYIENNGSMNVYNNGLSSQSVRDVSSDLRSWYHYVYDDIHIKRIETQQLLSWIEENAEKNRDRLHILVGDAGSGKSVILRDVLVELEKQGTAVIGLKADQLFARINSLENLNISGQPVTQTIRNYAKEHRVVLIIDQIDALSSTLSSDRTSLYSVNSLIDEVCSLRNVRVIVSCRPYDLNYDPTLERYRRSSFTMVNGLQVEDVKMVLKRAGIIINNNEDVINQFLTNPLNLFLFCRVKDANLFGKSIPNRTMLYEALWKQKIKDVPGQLSGISTGSLKECLDMITQEMYERQVLSIPKAKVDISFGKEVNYLCSNSLLYCSDDKMHLQFIHQSLYDYVYACLFFANGKSLDDILGNIHQGLFVRLRLKQILFYLRDVDEDSYLKNLRELLFSKNTDGSSKYRFHLKHLMLSNMGYLDSLSENEIHFIKNYILKDGVFAEIYLESINTTAGFNVFAEVINYMGGFDKIGPKRQKQLINACYRVMFSNQNVVLDYLLSVDTKGLDGELTGNLEDVLNRMPVNSDCIDKLERLIVGLDVIKEELPYRLLMQKIWEFDPDFVCNRMLQNIDAVTNKPNKEILGRRFIYPDNLDSMLRFLKDKDELRVFKLVLSMIQTISRKTLLKDNEYVIKSSYEFLMFNEHDHYKFEHVWLTYLIDEVKKLLRSEPGEMKSIIKELSMSDLATDVVVALCAYKYNVDDFIKESVDLTKRIINSEHSSSVLDYYARSLFEALVPKLDKKDTDIVMNALENFAPKWESTLNQRRTENLPITYTGYSKARYYELVPKGILDSYPKAKKHLDEMKRKFYIWGNEEPNKMSCHDGWTALKDPVYSEMSVPEMEKTMLEIDSDDDHQNWDKPTMTGHAMKLGEMVASRPDDCYKAYMSVVDKGVRLDYPLYGLEGLLKCKYDINRINVLTERVIARFDKDISNNKSDIVIQALRLISRYYENKQAVPDCLFDFACDVAIRWNDSEYKTEKGELMSYQDGINQVRGWAAESLIMSYDYPGRGEKIFDVYEAIADNGSVPTRAATLFRLALLMNVDKERCKNTFLSLTKDYATSLLNLPLHNLNPLLYLISYDFKSLEDYFEASIVNVRTHEINVSLLWIAWVRNIDGAKELMLRMSDSSVEARASLIKSVCFYFKPDQIDKALDVLYRYVDLDEHDTGSGYDAVFSIIEQWDRQQMIMFVDRFVISNACKYASRKFMGFLGRMASEEPDNCLKWIADVYEKKKDLTDWSYYVSNLIDFLIKAYNGIGQYDKENPILEKAMDLMDLWLHDNVNRQHLSNCFKLLDN